MKRFRTEEPAVSARSEIIIRASSREVWDLITGIERWPGWVSGVSGCKIDGDFAPGTSFYWKSKGIGIRSVIRQVDEGRKLVWTGRSAGIRAEHSWSIEELDDGTVQVVTGESMFGFMARLFMNNRKLEQVLSAWLHDLKKAAEAGTSC
jgi:hypothetical protein